MSLSSPMPQLMHPRQLAKAFPGYHLVTKTVTFAGGTTDAVGNDGGALDPYTLFNVTGLVAVKLFARCTTDLASAGGGTVEVGTAINTAGIIAQTTATAVDINEIWHDNSPDSSVEASTVVAEKLVAQNIILTTGTADVTAGVVEFYCFWCPISADANVTSNVTN